MQLYYFIGERIFPWDRFWSKFHLLLVLTFVFFTFTCFTVNTGSYYSIELGVWCNWQYCLLRFCFIHNFCCIVNLFHIFFSFFFFFKCSNWHLINNIFKIAFFQFYLNFSYKLNYIYNYKTSFMFLKIFVVQKVTFL